MAGSQGEPWEGSRVGVFGGILKMFVRLVEGSGDDGVECLEFLEGPSF